ncbi:MAG: peptide ABC transporter ATP-binding protein [Sulfobacillus benefaciens]|uniref:Peptide ABC transporter ATP-binding protein n=1 Tax=Sulfobacillus benefaciens TaxID=453960 RepID=A0A2T2XF89_9FIRM|nr:MAG: peptide ABC transporter ATP-binding protein [Sulfobacillus benefaciens]
MPDKVLDVKNLSTYFYTDEGVVRSVDGVSFHIDAEETLGIVGESGCGKSVTSLSIMQLVPNPPGKIVGGEILFQGENLLTKTAEQMRKIRGNDIAMIFQEPMTSLNPVYTIGDQIAEAVILHQKLTKKAAFDRAVEMLRLVGIPSPERRAREYPHQMSGGMRQRVMIAMALSCNPTLLIADEPTTALDVTIQAQILDLMRKLKQEFHTAIMLITHDLGVVAEMTDRVAVMYAGKVVEECSTVDLFREPLHPYTEGLLESIPRLDVVSNDKLHVIEGTVPNLLHLPQGCSFAPRCPRAMEICRQEAPVLTEVSDGRKVSCWLHSEGKEAAS